MPGTRAREVGKRREEGVGGGGGCSGEEGWPGDALLGPRGRVPIEAPSCNFVLCSRSSVGCLKLRSGSIPRAARRCVKTLAEGSSQRGPNRSSSHARRRRVGGHDTGATARQPHASRARRAAHGKGQPDPSPHAQQTPQARRRPVLAHHHRTPSPSPAASPASGASTTATSGSRELLAARGAREVQRDCPSGHQTPRPARQPRAHVYSSAEYDGVCARKSGCSSTR